MTGFTIILGENDSIHMKDHFCRRREDCVGGISYEEAKQEIIQHYKGLIDQWERGEHPDAKYFKE